MPMMKRPHSARTWTPPRGLSTVRFISGCRRRAVLHLHPVYTTSIACLANPQILPIDQNSALF
jgi:hypothetical protein